MSDSARTAEGSQAATTGKEGVSAPPVEGKRKYRRHPKPDDSAPEKPPSAYVLFSNRIREEVKSENLTFTEIAKLVGDRWQKLDPLQKEPFESQANELKDKYHVQLSAYKKTDSYREYAQYLNEFKAKHGPQTEPKRPKLDPQSSGSASAASVEASEAFPTIAQHARVGSISSVSAASLASAVTSPQGTTLSHVPSMPNITSTNTRGLPSLARPNSPQALQFSRDRRLIGQLSTNSSTSDDSGQVPYDALSRTATLSLSTPPTGTPPLPPHGLGTLRLDSNASAEGFVWSSRAGPPAHQPGTMTPSGPSPLGSGITLPSPTLSSDPWRDRAMDWTRQIQPSPSSSAMGQVPALPLPPLLSPDRLSEFNQVQRTLPPLRHNTTSSATSPSAYQSTPSAAYVSRQLSADSERRFSQSHEGGARQLERNENEAASVLSSLATRPGQDTPHSRSHGRRRPQ